MTDLADAGTVVPQAAAVALLSAGFQNQARVDRAAVFAPLRSVFERPDTGFIDSYLKDIAAIPYSDSGWWVCHDYALMALARGLDVARLLTTPAGILLFPAVVTLHDPKPCCPDDWHRVNRVLLTDDATGKVGPVWYEPQQAKLYDDYPSLDQAVSAGDS